MPVPFLVLAYLVPGLVWLAAFALWSRFSSSRTARTGRRRACLAIDAGGLRPRAGSLLTLAIVVFLTQAVLAFILRGFGDTAEWVAYFLASVVVSPLVFVGSALLYVDQAARAEVV